MALTGRIHSPADVDAAKTTLLHVTGKGILKSISGLFKRVSKVTDIYLNVDGSGEKKITRDQFEGILGGYFYVGAEYVPILTPIGGGMGTASTKTGTILFNLPFTTSLVVSARELDDITIMYMLDV